MKPCYRLNWEAILGGVLGYALIFAGIIALCAFCSCATIQAVTAAPEEFWITVDTILSALFEDVMSIVRLLL